jgi:hypothetical protein
VEDPCGEREVFANQLLNYYRTSSGAHFIRCFNGGIEKIYARSSSLRIVELVILFLNWLLSIDII